ncbi:MAG: ferrous iron transport protein B [Verrucomicrobiota bacterium]
MLVSPRKPISSPNFSTTYVVLTGNPNSGKTTLFNALTGLRAKVGNYPGVTVERKEGRLLGTSEPITVLDLPGTYSLSPKSLDEQISRDVLFHRVAEVPPPGLVVVVIDASNLERNLYYATQVIELGYPTIVALNMIDVAESIGQHVDPQALEKELGVRVFPMVASTGQGVTALKQAMTEVARQGTIPVIQSNNAIAPTRDRASAARFCALSEAFQKEVNALADLLCQAFPDQSFSTQAEALLLLSDEKMLEQNAEQYPDTIHQCVRAARARLDALGQDWRSVAIEARYARIAGIHEAVCTHAANVDATFSDKLDRVLTHRFWGMIIFVAIMALMFQSIFTFAEYPMTWLEDGVAAVGGWIEQIIPPGDLRSLIVDGVIAGVGAVVVFLPQICLLFLFIGLLEDTGYMARAAFLMDRLMSKVGLHGKSFIPMLSSFACAIPGIMATRTIETPKDRLVTILVAPLMSCSARLPVYTLLIAACIPNQRILGFFKLPGLTMLSMYLLGIVVALLMAWLFKKTLLKGETPLLIMELPPYKMPLLRIVIRHMWERSKLFLRRAGTVILGISILLWFLATYPRSASVEQAYAVKRQAIESIGAGQPESQAIQEARSIQLEALEKETSGERLRRSFAGRLGHLLEPVIAPLGFDWKIGIGIVASFAAREVFVSTMSTVYNVGSDDSDESINTLADTLRQQTRTDGSPVYTPLVAITLMVFYVFALQCVSTVAVVRRETNSWKWPLFQWAYMGALAWIFAFATYQIGRLLGW